MITNMHYRYFANSIALILLLVVGEHYSQLYCYTTINNTITENIFSPINGLLNGISQWYDPSTSYKLFIYIENLFLLFLYIFFYMLLKYIDKKDQLNNLDLWQLISLLIALLALNNYVAPNYNFQIKIGYLLSNAAILLVFINIALQNGQNVIFKIYKSLPVITSSLVFIAITAYSIFILLKPVIIGEYARLNSQNMHVKLSETHQQIHYDDINTLNNIPPNCISNVQLTKAAHETVKQGELAAARPDLKINSGEPHFRQGLLYESDKNLCYIGDKDYLLNLQNLPDQDDSFQSAINKLSNKISLDEKTPSTDTQIHLKNELQPELLFLSQARGYIHHWLRVLRPVDNFVNGRNSIFNEYSQYGIGYVLWGALPFTVSGNTPSLETLITTFFFAYPLFLALVFYTSFLISGRNILLATLPTSLVLLSWSYFGHLGITAIPGYNPLRFILMPLVLFYLYRYFELKKTFYLILLSVTSLASIIISKEFGVMIFLSATIGMIFAFLLQKNISAKFISGMLGISIIAVLIYIGVGTGTSTGSQFTSGLHSLTPDLDFINRVIVFALLSFLVLVILAKSHLPSATAAISMLAFLLFSISYYIVIHTPDHLGVILSLSGFVPFFILNIVRKSNWVNENIKSIFWSTLSIFTLLISVYSIHSFNSSIKEFNHELRGLKISHWKNEHIDSKVTFDFEPLDTASNAIQKYNTNQGAVIISKYSDILYYLASKKSPVSEYDFVNDIPTFTDQNLLIQKIQAMKPEYIFADADIDYFIFNDVMSAKMYGIYYHNETFWRAQRMQNLKRIFDSVSEDYRKIENAGVVSIYKRINP